MPYNQQYMQKEVIPNHKLESRTYSGGLEAEMSLLGSLLLDPSNLLEIEAFLSGKDFYAKGNERIFEAIRELFHDEKCIDPVTFVNHLRNKHELATIGGEQYIATLLIECYSSAHAIEYAKIVKDWSNKRDFERANREALNNLIKDAWQAEKVLAKQIDVLEKISEEIQKEKKSFNVSELIASIVDEATTPKTNESVRTGLGSLDQLGVLNATELTVIAARPSMGKTALAINIIENVCDRGVQTMFFSLEMSDVQIVSRMMSSRTGINSDLFKQHELGGARFNDVQMQDMRNAGNTIHAMPLTVFDDPAMTVKMMKAALRIKNKELDKQNKKQVGLVVIDYLQEMIWNRKEFYSEENALANFTREFKAMANKHEIPVILISQLNREVEKRADMRPKLADLRGSGSIEQVADVVLMLWREDHAKKKKAGEPNQMSVAHIFCAKNRNGGVGDIDLNYFPWKHKFEDTWQNENDRYGGSIL